MADIGVLLRGLDKPMLFEAEEWKFSERFLRLLEGDHVVAQFPTRSVLGVWFEETPAISESTADVVVVLPHSYAGELGAEDVAGEQTEA